MPAMHSSHQHDANESLPQQFQPFTARINTHSNTLVHVCTMQSTSTTNYTVAMSATTLNPAGETPNSAAETYNNINQYC
jgi:hypothetical protein